MSRWFVLFVAPVALWESTPETARFCPFNLTDAILDGEIVCLDGKGRSIFKEVMQGRGDPIFYSFDFLWLNGAQMISEAPDPALCNYSLPRIPVVPYVSTDV
jgi:hypothetical protein